MQQAARVSDVTAFFWLGKLVECGPTDKIFTAPVGEADRGLRHRTVRLMARSTERDVPHFQEELEQLKARLLEMGGLAEERVRLGGASARRARPRRWSSACSRGDGADQPAAHRDRQPLLQAAGAAPADGGGPARHRLGGEDQHRPRARRRPRRQHRRGGAALPAAPAGQEADRHPADGGHRAGHAARRARRLRPPRHRARPARAERGRRARRAEDADLPRAARPTCCRTRPRSSRRST